MWQGVANEQLCNLGDRRRKWAIGVHTGARVLQAVETMYFAMQAMKT